MTWTELSALFHGERKKLEARVIPPHLVIPELCHATDLLSLECDLRPRLDAAVASFAVANQWQQLTLLEQALLYERFLFAEELSYLIESKKIESPVVDHANLIEWTLVDAWHRASFTRLSSIRAESLQRFGTLAAAK